MKPINDSGAHILFICLSVPKQEKWMAAHKGKIKDVQLGVGAAISFVAGKAIRKRSREIAKKYGEVKTQND